MAKTRLSPDQIEALHDMTLEERLMQISYLAGQVDNETQLEALTPNEDDQVFVKSLNRLKRYTGGQWIDVTFEIDESQLILQVTSSTRPFPAAVGQHIFESDTSKTYRNIGVPLSPIWEEVGAGSSGGGSGGGGFVSQVTKLNVTASSGAPYEVLLEIPETPDFKRLAPEVLKFVAGTDNVVKTLVAFNNADAADFQPNEFVIFDGTMKLKTTYDIPMVEDTSWTGGGKLYSAVIDKSKFKSVEKIEVL